MEILAVILSALSLIVSVIILLMVKNKGSASLSGEDVDKIRDAASREINNVSTYIEQQNKHFIELVNEKLENQAKITQERLNNIDNNVGKSLSDIRRESSEKLNEIQKAVDEKLQKALDERLKTSFDNVVAQIGNVNKAIGEIRSIADDVGSLKNVLSNFTFNSFHSLIGNIQ